MRVNVVLAEDNDYLANSLKEGFQIFSEQINLLFRAKNGKELVDYIKNNDNIDVILMDIEMPEMDGIQATEEVSDINPSIKIIILTVYDDDDKIFKAIQAGAKGYLLKDESVEKIIEGINIVLEGGATMSGPIAAKTLQLLKNQVRPVNNLVEGNDFKLTKREVEVLECLQQGLDYNKTAEKLFISPFTVRKHIENIYRKLQVNNKVQAIQKAASKRII